MSISTHFSKNNTVYTISIEGDFNFSILHEFNAAYMNNDKIKSVKIIVDMMKTETIDSSALGMLLNMMQHLNKEDREISIINSNSFVTKILNITNFKVKFNIE